jgi:hypothetical protein
VKRRPDWSGEREKRLVAFRSARKERNQERRRKFKDMTVEEMDALSAEIRAGIITIEKLIAKTKTPEFQTEIVRMREERRQAINDLNDALLDAGDSVAERFAGIEADVPAYDENGDEFWLCFDGSHLLWFEPRHGMKNWAPVRTAPMRIRTAVAHNLQILLATLKGRRWMVQPPRNKFTNRSVPELETRT